jgi:hypothetical protein
VKLPEENRKEIFQDIGIGNDFLNRHQIAQKIIRSANGIALNLKVPVQQEK